MAMYGLKSRRIDQAPAMAVVLSSVPEEEFLNFNLDEKRRKLEILYHAAHCRREEVGDCDRQRHCCAAKRIFQHMITCTRECDVPACKKCRAIWKHYRKCRDRNCVLCQVVPTKYNSKAMCARFRKSGFSSEESHQSSVAADASVGSMSVLSGRRYGERKTAETLSVSTGKENKSTGTIQAPTKQVASSGRSVEETMPQKRPPRSPGRPMWALF